MVRRAHSLVKVFISLLLLLQSCSGVPEHENMRLFNAATLHAELRNGLLFKDDQPFTGIVYTLQTNGRDTAEIVTFNRGKEHGTWKKYYPNGKPMEKRSFINGQKTGQCQAWWPNGVLKLDCTFKDGEYDGLYREWTAQGLLIEKMTYKNGHENGNQQQFYNDGKVKANYTIINGRRYGLLGTKNCVNVADSIFKK